MKRLILLSALLLFFSPASPAFAADEHDHPPVSPPPCRAPIPYNEASWDVQYANCYAPAGAVRDWFAAPEIANYSETCTAMGSDTTPEYSLATSNCYTDTIDTGATTATFSDPPSSGKMGNLTLILTNGGSQTYNWPASVDWAGGTAPSLTAAGVDVIDCMTVDGGTIWYCFAAGLDMQ